MAVFWNLARELTAAAEAHPDQGWPPQALRALHGLNTAAHHARDQQLPAIPPEIAQPLLDSWRHALLVGLAEHRRAPGRKQWLRIRGYISTVAKHGDNILEALRDAIIGNPWTPPATC
jgi:hypothetical protein